MPGGGGGASARLDPHPAPSLPRARKLHLQAGSRVDVGEGLGEQLVVSAVEPRGVKVVAWRGGWAWGGGSNQACCPVILRPRQQAQAGVSCCCAPPASGRPPPRLGAPNVPRCMPPPLTSLTSADHKRRAHPFCHCRHHPSHIRLVLSALAPPVAHLAQGRVRRGRGRMQRAPHQQRQSPPPRCASARTAAVLRADSCAHTHRRQRRPATHRQEGGQRLTPVSLPTRRGAATAAARCVHAHCHDQHQRGRQPSAGEYLEPCAAGCGQGGGGGRGASSSVDARVRGGARRRHVRAALSSAHLPPAHRAAHTRSQLSQHYAGKLALEAVATGAIAHRASTCPPTPLAHTRCPPHAPAESGRPLQAPAPPNPSAAGAQPVAPCPRSLLTPWCCCCCPVWWGCEGAKAPPPPHNLCTRHMAESVERRGPAQHAWRCVCPPHHSPHTQGNPWGRFWGRARLGGTPCTSAVAGTWEPAWWT